LAVHEDPKEYEMDNMQWKKKNRLYPSIKNYEIHKKARNTVICLLKEDRLRHQQTIVQRKSKEILRLHETGTNSQI